MKQLRLSPEARFLAYEYVLLCITRHSNPACTIFNRWLSSNYDFLAKSCREIASYFPEFNNKKPQDAGFGECWFDTNSERKEAIKKCMQEVVKKI